MSNTKYRLGIRDLRCCEGEEMSAERHEELQEVIRRYQGALSALFSSDGMKFRDVPDVNRMIYDLGAELAARDFKVRSTSWLDYSPLPGKKH